MRRAGVEVEAATCSAQRVDAEASTPIIIAASGRVVAIAIAFGAHERILRIHRLPEEDGSGRVAAGNGICRASERNGLIKHMEHMEHMEHLERAIPEELTRVLHIAQIHEHQTVTLRRTSAIGIEVGMATFEAGAQGAARGVQHLHELCIGLVESIFGRHGRRQCEERPRRIQSDYLLHLAIEHGAGIASRMGTEAVARQRHVGAMKIRRTHLLQRNDNARHSQTHVEYGHRGALVVVLRQIAPVHHAHVVILIEERPGWSKEGN